MDGGLPTSRTLGSVLHGVHRFFDFYVSTCGGLRRLCSPGSRRCYPGCPGALHGSTVHCTTERSASLRSELVEWLFSGIIANGVVQELGVSFFGMVKNSFGAPVVFCILLPRRLILCFSPSGQTLLLGASGDVICGDSWPNVFMVVYLYLSQSVKLAEIYRIFPHHQN